MSFLKTQTKKQEIKAYLQDSLSIFTFFKTNLIQKNCEHKEISLDRMTLPASRVAYYGLIFIGIILAFIFHVFAVAGQYWTRFETINGTEVYWHSGLWKYCEDHYSYQKCERLNNVTGKLELFFCCPDHNVFRLSLFCFSRFVNTPANIFTFFYF